MGKITSEILAKVAPGTSKSKRDRFLADFNSVLPRYGITTELRVAAFLTTVCFESDYFKALAEYADGWAYDISRNRKKALSLGNTEVGDGPKYKGAGGIETTGKNNYRRLSERLGVDFVKHPELLRTEKYFVEAACVFWDDNHFNVLADKGKFTAIQNLTNRGDADKPALGLTNRKKIYQSVLDILPNDFNLSATSDIPTTQNEQRDDDQSTALKPAEPVAERPLLKFGDKGQDVLDLQNALNLPTTGDFDVATKRGVLWFQRDYSKSYTPGLTVDGIAGPATWAALEAQHLDGVGAAGGLLPEDRTFIDPNLKLPPQTESEGSAGDEKTPPASDDPVIVDKVVAEDGIISKVKVWYGAVSGGAGTVLAGLIAWLQGASTVIIISSAASVTVIALVWMIQKHIATQKEADRQLEREKMAHDLTKLQMESAASTTLNTVKLA